MVVEKSIMKERKQTRHDLGREKFVAEVYICPSLSLREFIIVGGIYQNKSSDGLSLLHVFHTSIFLLNQQYFVWFLISHIFHSMFRCTSGRTSTVGRFANSTVVSEHLLTGLVRSVTYRLVFHLHANSIAF